MSELSLIVTPLGLLKPDIKVSLTDDSILLKEQALAASKKITFIGTPKEMEGANPVLRLLKNTLKHMEEGRKILKAPITKLGKDVDGVANAYKEELEVEEDRLKSLVADFTNRQAALQVQEIRTNGTSSIVASGGEGISTTDEWKFEIENEKEAYLASPGLFTLVPNAVAIKAAAKAGFPMPFIKTWKETGVRVKA